MAKAKVGFYWCSSCGGCEEAVVDLAEQLLPLLERIEIVFWPVALDFKRADLEEMADASIDVMFVNGAVRMDEQEEMARLVRRKAKLVVAYGACAWLGGIPGLANLFDKDAILKYVYRLAPTIGPVNGDLAPTPRWIAPEGELHLPEFYDAVKTLDQVIEVDYYLPGCPPTPKLTAQAVLAILDGTLPERGAVLAGNRALCHECELNDTKPEELAIAAFRRPHEVVPEPGKCLLAEGLLCLGPVTRGGCEARCIKGGMPCTGCFGPLERVRDFGGKAVAAMASILDSTDEKAVTVATASIPDPAGTFYRYSLPAALVSRRRS